MLPVIRAENARADVIVVDPPRKGCDEILLDTIVEMQPDRGCVRKLRFRHPGKGSENICAREGYQVAEGVPGGYVSHDGACG